MNKKTIVTLALFIAVSACVGAIAHEGFNKGGFGPGGPRGPMGQMHGGPHGDIAKQHMIEFEKKLGLTDEQKETIKKNQEKSREKMKKIIEKERKLQEEKHKIMEQNRKDFEAILTDEQKETLKKMHEERIQKMKEWKEKNGNKIQKGKKSGSVEKPLPVKPKTETK